MKSTKKIKILFVAMADSIHTARWIAQIADERWEIYLFSSQDCVLPHQELKNTTVYQTLFPRESKNNHKIEKIKANIFDIFRFIVKRLLFYISKALHQELLEAKIIKDLQESRLKRLCHLIKKIQPDIIHSMEFQKGAYLTLEAKNVYKGKFPTWIVTNWGNDIYFFRYLIEHERKIRQLLKECDFYSCECHRDVCLAKEYGLKGKPLPVFPNTGGFDLKEIRKNYRWPRTSKRKIILLKGYQGLFGRAMVGLRALERCAELLLDYKIVIFGTYKGSDVDYASRIFSKKTGIKTEIVPFANRKHILELQNQARIYLGVNVSDGASTSMLESIVMGSFPIQANTACADEWITNGKNGFIVPPEDPEIVEKALRKALTDDKLVDSAAQINWQIAKERLAMEKLKQKTINFYREVYNEKIS